jgi:hypothetical protein
VSAQQRRRRGNAHWQSRLLGFDSEAVCSVVEAPLECIGERPWQTLHCAHLSQPDVRRRRQTPDPSAPLVIAAGRAPASRSLHLQPRARDTNTQRRRADKASDKTRTQSPDPQPKCARCPNAAAPSPRWHSSASPESCFRRSATPNKSSSGQLLWERRAYDVHVRAPTANTAKPVQRSVQRLSQSASWVKGPSAAWKSSKGARRPRIEANASPAHLQPWPHDAGTAPLR